MTPLSKSPNDYFIYAGLAAAYAQLGRKEDAALAAKQTMHAWSFFDAATFAAQFQGERYRSAIVDGLRKAGLN